MLDPPATWLQILAADQDLHMKLLQQVDRVQEPQFEYDATYIRSNIGHLYAQVRPDSTQPVGALRTKLHSDSCTSFSRRAPV